MCAQDVAADDATFVVGQQFHDSFGLAHCQRFSVGAIIAFVALVGRFLSLALVFAPAHASRFGRREDGGRHDVETNRIGSAENVVDSPQTLHGGGMCEHLPTIHVADGIESEDVGLHVVIDDDACLVDGHARRLDAFGQNGFPSHGNEHLVGLDGSALSLAFEGHTLGSHSRYSTLHEELHTLLLERLAQSFGNVAVEVGQAFLQELDDRHLATKRVEDAGELHSNDARSHNAEMAGQRGGVEQV